MLDYVATGIPGVNKILGEQGIPRGHSILICGGPGSGKLLFKLIFDARKGCPFGVYLKGREVKV